jgi:hypothetical protein
MPRNGFATIQQFVDGTNAVFGMAKDLASFLSIYGASVNGNGIGWSIGGIPRTGISGSHNNYETDSSPLRSDLNQYGSNRRIIIDQFTRLYNLQPDAATANYNLEVLRKFRGTRFSESVNKNPYFFYGPFTGIQVSQAAHTFIYRFMANKSAEYPEGILNKEVLKAFMAIEGPEDNLQWVPGHERIPNNWYKRNPADEYSIPYFETDLLAFASTQPQIISVGCNMGKVNSYNMISVEEISGGAYTAQDVATNPFCYSIESIRYSAPSLLGLAGSLLTGLLDMLVPLEQTFGCQPFNGNGNFTALKACPGFSIYGGPSGPVAPGAIQS